MSSIEDILNADDSDDDIESSENLDLEHLLHSRDDFDEPLDPSTIYRVGEVHNEHQTVQNDSDPGDGSISHVVTQDFVDDTNHSFLSLDDDSTEGLDTKEQRRNESVHLARLHQAELRERNFLDPGQKVL